MSDTPETTLATDAQCLINHFSGTLNIGQLHIHCDNCHCSGQPETSTPETATTPAPSTVLSTQPVALLMDINATQFSTAASIDHQGRLAITGDSYDPKGLSLTRFNAGMTTAEQIVIGKQGVQGYEYICHDEDDHIYITTEVNSSNYLAHFDSEMNLLSQVRFEHHSPLHTNAMQYHNGHLYLCGSLKMSDSSNNYSLFLVKLNKDLQLQASHVVTDTNKNQLGYGLAISDQGDVYITGYMSSGILYVAQLDESLTVQKEQTVSGIGIQYDLALAADGTLRCLGQEAVGRFSASLDTLTVRSYSGVNMKDMQITAGGDIWLSGNTPDKQGRVLHTDSDFNLLGSWQLQHNSAHSTYLYGGCLTAQDSPCWVGYLDDPMRALVINEVLLTDSLPDWTIAADVSFTFSAESSRKTVEYQQQPWNLPPFEIVAISEEDAPIERRQIELS